MSMYDDDYYDHGYDGGDPDDEGWLIDGVGFAEPGGGSALRAATPDNPRDLPCPSCGWPNRLTRIDAARGYQCDSCANAAERGLDVDYYEGDEAEHWADDAHATIEAEVSDDD